MIAIKLNLDSLESSNIKKSKIIAGIRERRIYGNKSDIYVSIEEEKITRIESMITIILKIFPLEEISLNPMRDKARKRDIPIGIIVIDKYVIDINDINIEAVRNILVDMNEFLSDVLIIRNKTIATNGIAK